MLEFYVSLQETVFWTKRVLVVLTILAFICSGVYLFQLIIKGTLNNQNIVSEQKAEEGFGKISLPSIPSIQTPAGFDPKDFAIQTIDGTLNTQNTYPLANDTNPIGNVYKIPDRSVDLSTKEVPLSIAKRIGFLTEGSGDSIVTNWAEGTKELSINGLYLLVNYKNRAFFTTRPPVQSKINILDATTVRSAYTSVLREFGLSITDLASYTFDAEYVEYDVLNSKFAKTSGLGGYIRINAIRTYPILSKVNTKATAKATYPDYLRSNNYIILPSDMSTTKYIDNLVELSLYNWPITNTATANKDQVQTYYLKTMTDAYNELKTSKKTLVHVSDWEDMTPVDIDELSGMNRIEIMNVRTDFFEDTKNTGYIQPVYVFVCISEHNGGKYRLVFYIPAVKYKN